MTRCDECRFWVADEKMGGSGECHRHAPLPQLKRAIEDGEEPSYLTSNDNFVADVVWPLTGSHDFCGEFISNGHSDK
jgi:hypothetical protein